jgi:hypothetical protein
MKFVAERCAGSEEILCPCEQVNSTSSRYKVNFSSLKTSVMSSI